MSGFKQINLEIKKRYPIAWDKDKKPTKFKTEVDEYGFNLFNISYWRGQTRIIEAEGEKDTIERFTYLYLTGNPKAIQLNMSREDFERQLKERVGNDPEAIKHLAQKAEEQADA